MRPDWTDGMERESQVGRTRRTNRRRDGQTDGRDGRTDETDGRTNGRNRRTRRMDETDRRDGRTRRTDETDGRDGRTDGTDGRDGLTRRTNGTDGQTGVTILSNGIGLRDACADVTARSFIHIIHYTFHCETDSDSGRCAKKNRVYDGNFLQFPAKCIFC